MIILCHLTLTLKYLDEYSWLIILISCESLLLFGWDSRISWDEYCHNLSRSFDTLGKSGYIKKKQVLHVFTTFSREDSCLDCSTICDGLIRVDRSVQVFAIEEILKHLLNFWNTSRTSDKYDFMNLTLSNIGILEHIFNWRHALAEMR